MAPCMIERKLLDQRSRGAYLSSIAQANHGGVEHGLVTLALKFVVMIFQMLGIHGRASERFGMVNVGKKNDAYGGVSPAAPRNGGYIQIFHRRDAIIAH